MSCCLCCGSNDLAIGIDLEQQPRSNSFFPNESDNTTLQKITFAACKVCGLIQLKNPMPFNLVRSEHNWLSYNEPENHLDDLASILLSKYGVIDKKRLVGLTYKDETLLARLKKIDPNKSFVLDKELDFNITDPRCGLETVQARLSTELASHIIEKYGKIDVLIARHLFEHSFNPGHFISFCKTLCTDDGLIILEVPDTSKILKYFHHFFIWEEHLSYFCEETLEGFLLEKGFLKFEILRYEQPYEDLLVAIIQNRTHEDASTVNSSRNVSLEPFYLFSREFYGVSLKIQEQLSIFKARGSKIAILGAGHLAIKFINFYGLSDYFCIVIDDNENKIGCFLPGTNIRIVDSSHLQSDSYDICFLTLNPESEKKFILKHKEYTEKGGKFLSIYSFLKEL